MRAPRGFAPTALALCIAAGSISLGGAACYRPNIKDGGLKCNLDAGAAHACPEGFTCDLNLLQCWKGPHGDGGPSDVPVDMPDGHEAGPEVVPPPCFDARPNCDPSDAGLCDPLCQTGCGCRQKCTVNADGGLACGQVASNAGAPLDPCDPTAANDSCGPGLVCMNDQCFGRCYQFCRADLDCPGSFCSRIAPGGLKVCDVPIADCNPIGTSNNCPGTAPGCYLSFNHPENTICDCGGGVMKGKECSGSRSCLPGGLVCIDPTTDGGTPLCLPVCELDGGSGCVGGAACIPYTGSSPSNTPNPKYGYCPS
jgi:hypothetical protein